MPNISRSKDNQTMKFGQLIDYNTRIIEILLNYWIIRIIEKWYTKYGGETSPRPFPEKLKLGISLEQYSKVLYSLLFM